jgi:hypothetical protein
MTNDWIKKNFNILKRISKNILKERWMEGISEYYIWSIENDGVLNERHFYYFMWNLKRGNSKINYIPSGFKGHDGDIEDFGDRRDLDKVDLMMDLGDEVAVDFLLNNENNERWLKIYEVVYKGGLDMNFFEKILFEYIFLEGLSIRDIVKITGNSQDYIYKQRKRLIERIKSKL